VGYYPTNRAPSFSRPLSVVTITPSRPHIRKRALHTIRALVECDSAMLRGLSPEISRRLRDKDQAVVGSALTVCISLHKNGLLGPDTLVNAYRVLHHYGKSSTGSAAAALVVRKALQLYCIVQPSTEVLKAIFEIIRRSANNPKTHVLLYDCSSVLRNTPTDILIPFTVSNGSPISHIRHLLSNDSSEQHLFLSCLACVPPAIWAGTTQDVPAVLEAWEVERVMQLLSAPDPALRLKTLRVLTDVDSSIIELYFSQRLEGLDCSVESFEDEVLALLEVIKILAGEDAELYARSIRDVLSPRGTAEPAGPDAQRNSQVLERAVENVLTSLRDGETTFGENVATTLLTPLAEVEADTSFSPTMMVVLTALACEYAGHVPVSPLELLRGLGKRLTSYPPSIQEISLLTMIRLAAECPKFVPEPISDVQHLKSKSGRHISRRCSLLEDMIGKPDELRAAVANSRSRSVRIIRSGYIHIIDALNYYNKYHVSFQTSSSRSIQDHRRVLDLPARVPPHALHRDHRAAEHRSFDMQPTRLHHPHSYVTLVLRGARRALHPLWIPTTTLRGPSPLETWQLLLAAQNCVGSHLPHRVHPSRPYLNWKPSICLAHAPI